MALLLAFDYHKRGLIEVLAVVCSYGNTFVDQVVKNVLITRRVAGTEDIRVYRGVENPLLERTGVQDFYFGIDGFGNISHILPPIEAPIESEQGVLAIIRLIKMYPKQITLMTLGPMTNLAMAIQLDQSLSYNLAQIVSIGGLLDPLGNVLPDTEFNFMNDPESVDMVLKKSYCPLTFVTWDVASRHIISKDSFSLLSSFGTEKSKFIETIFDILLKSANETESIILCDILGVIGGIVPELVVESQEFPVAMQLSGQLSRGMLVVGRTRLIKPFYGSRNVTFVQKIDLQKVIQLITQMAIN